MLIMIDHDYKDDNVQVSVEGEPHEKAVELLKAALSSVKLVVRLILTTIISLFVCHVHLGMYVQLISPRYTPKVLEEMELRFDKQRKARQRQMYS